VFLDPQGETMSELKEVTVGIRELEPGFTMFVFDAPPRLAQSRLHCLLNTMNSWRNHFPERRVEDLQIVRDKGLVRGLNVFWSLFENKKGPHTFNFQVHNDVTAMYGKEYLEALMHDSSKFMTEVKQPHPVCALLSRREIVIVAYQTRAEGSILTYELFLKTLAPPFAEAVDASFAEFKRSDTQGYHVVALPDSYVVAMD
jgi:hypothetical protein